MADFLKISVGEETANLRIALGVACLQEPDEPWFTLAYA